MAAVAKAGIAEDWQPLCDLLKEKIVAKIAEQDHNATGALSQSVEVVARELPDRWVIEALANNYGKFVNNGRRVGAPMPPISVIYRWMQQRGIGNELQRESQKRGLAYVISRSIAQKGIPPQGGYSSHYAKGNSIKRTGWADDVIAENEEQIYAMVEEVIGKVADWIIFNKYKRTATFLGNGNK
ncbi:MAG: hypothetical protein IIX42_04555 [Alistipes sp.]|nr:hypothetical protein [Alistipes sp.]